MFTTNPFAILAETIPMMAIQSFVIIMVGLVILGTVLDMIHKKNVKYFFNNAKKAKKSAKKELGTGERLAVIGKTIIHDIGTTAELGWGKRRIAHVLGMYGTILFWIGSAAMIFFYTDSQTPNVWPILWHVGAIMTCLGGYWFWPKPVSTQTSHYCSNMPKNWPNVWSLRIGIKKYHCSRTNPKKDCSIHS